MEIDYNSVKCISILKQANDVCCLKTKSIFLKEWCSYIKKFGYTICSETINGEHFFNQINKLLSSSLIQEFSGREYTSYDKNDFKDSDVYAQATLQVATELFIILSTSKTESSNAGDLRVREISYENRDQRISPNCEIEFKILPNLLQLIGGNINNPVWSSLECQTLSIHLLKIITEVFNCTIEEILVNGIFYRNQCEFRKLKENNILSVLLHLMEVPLSRERWEKNPFLCQVFCWLIHQVNSPNLSNHIDQIMATSLNFIHSHEMPYKLNGLHSLQHLIENVSGEELRWFNRAEVIYETMKNQIYVREENVLDNVLQCIFLIVKVLERFSLEKADKHHELLTILLRDAEMENLIVIRRVIISNLSEFVLDCGILCVQHLIRIVRLVETFLEIEDMPNEKARIKALQMLENVLTVAWPRIGDHSQNILQFLLKLVINIETQSYCDMEKKDTKDKLLMHILSCVKLLLKVNPELHSSLEEIRQSKELFMLKDFVSNDLFNT